MTDEQIFKIMDKAFGLAVKIRHNHVGRISSNETDIAYVIMAKAMFKEMLKNVNKSQAEDEFARAIEMRS